MKRLQVSLPNFDIKIIVFNMFTFIKFESAYPLTILSFHKRVAYSSISLGAQSHSSCAC